MAALPTRPVVVAASTVLVGLLVVGGVGVLTDDGVAAAVHDSGDHPEWVHEANFTIRFTNPTPGEATGAVMWASLPQTEAYGEGLEEGKFVQIWLPQAWSRDIESESDMACSRDDVSIAGIDRGANDSGTAVDDSLVSNVKNYEISQNDDGQTWAMVEAYGKEDFGGDHVSAHYSDEAVVKVDDCFQTPNEPGWYRGGFYANGTNYQGEYVEAAGYTSYFYLCDCQDREEAIEKLGEPPVKGTGFEGTVIRADSKGIYGDTLDGAPPGSWDLQSKRSSDTSGDEGDATTPTEAPNDDGGTDNSGTDDGSDGAEDNNAGGSGDTAATQTTGADDSGSADDGGAGSGDDGSVTKATASSQDGGGSGNGAQPGTPTTSDGPGFGTVVALAGLFASTLLLSRRD